VAGQDAWFFADERELAALLRKVDRLPAAELRRLRGLSATRAEQMFSWSSVAKDYLDLLVPR